jgi:hypothetical protein
MQTPAAAALLDAVRACHQGVVEAQSTFHVSLNFTEAISVTAGGPERMLVLLLDEFDEAFAALDGRVFLNLRAR